MTDILMPERIWIEGNTIYAAGFAAQHLSTTLQQFGVTNATGEIINPVAFDTWLYKTQPATIGQDSAMEACFDDHC